MPSWLGPHKCESLEIEWLRDEELELRMGQANDALHDLRIALADKAVLFRTDVRHADSQVATTRAWGRVSALDSSVKKHAQIYSNARRAMIALGAADDILCRYQELSPADLKVSSAITDPNGRGHRNDGLAWFWSMDVPRDTAVNNWMSECKQLLNDYAS